MMEGVLRHCTDMTVEKNYVDTHGQSEIAFAFSYLLGFELGAIAYPHSLYPTLLLIGITWALLLPLLYRWTQSAPVSVHAPA